MVRKFKTWTVIFGYMDYNKREKLFTGDFYFNKPTTRHTNPDIVSKKVKVEEC